MVGVVELLEHRLKLFVLLAAAVEKDYDGERDDENELIPLVFGVEGKEGIRGPPNSGDDLLDELVHAVYSVLYIMNEAN